MVFDEKPIQPEISYKEKKPVAFKLKFVISVILISSILIIGLFFYLQFLKIDIGKVTESELSFFKNSYFPNNCTSVRTFQIENGKYIPAYGNRNLLFVHTTEELYLYTGNETYLSDAEKLVECVESTTIPVNFDNVPFLEQRIPKDFDDQNIRNVIKAAYWGDYLSTLSKFYSIKKENPAYLQNIADYLQDVNLDFQFETKDQTNSFILSAGSIPRGMIQYYKISNNVSHLNKSKEMLDFLYKKYSTDLDIVGNSELVKDYLIFYGKTKDESILARIRMLSDFVVGSQLSDGSFCPGLDRLKIKCTTYAVMSLNLCWQELKNVTCKNSLLKGILFMAKKVDSKNGFVGTGKAPDMLSDTVFVRILVKYHTDLKSI